MMTRMSDAHLVYKVLDSDQQAYEALVSRYYAQVNRFCIAKVSNPHDAEDLTQEVFIRAYANLHKLRSPEKFRPWLLSISANLIKKYFRDKYQNETCISLEDLTDSSLYKRCTDPIVQTTEDLVLGQLDFSPLHRFMHSMPEHLNESLTMHYLNDMTYKDIARLLKLPISTVKARMYNARQWVLRNSLSRTTPKELRNQIGELVTNVARNHEELSKVLYTNMLENQPILALLDPIKLQQVPIKVFTYTLSDPDKSDNLMIMADIHPLTPTVVIKSKEQIAVRAFLQLLPKSKPLRAVVLEQKLWNVIDEFALTDNPTEYFTYYLTPQEIRKTNISEGVTEIELTNTLILENLSSQDKRLSGIIKSLKNENPEYPHSLRLFVHEDSSGTIDTYALFIHSGIGNLWELASYSSFLDDYSKYLGSCISLGSSLLLKQGYHITVNGILSHNATFQSILLNIGFRHMLTFVGATILVE